MLNILKSKKYLIYAGSIFVGRGLEFLVFYYAAFVFTKSDFGELEFYRKFIEVISIGVSFGFPALLMSYTRGDDNKKYFFLLSFIGIIFLSIICFFVSLFFQNLIFIIPLLFYAIFFTGGINQAYILVKSGSEKASVYKIVISLLFYSVLFLLIYFFQYKATSIIYTTYILIVPLLILMVYYFRSLNLSFYKLKKYFNLFKKLLFGSLTMVLSDFSNLVFIYTDIFIIKFLSDNANSELADFSFSMNIAALVLIVSTTIVQVNIEKLKDKSGKYLKSINNQIILLSVVLSACLIIAFWFAIETIFIDYQNTLILFIIILIAKNFQSLSNLFGTQILILKEYNINLVLNLIFLVLNLIFCYVFYKIIGLYGIAFSSLICLMSRYFLLITINKRLILKLNNGTVK